MTAFFDRYRELVAARARPNPLAAPDDDAPHSVPSTLDVGPGVFIPRPETEALLEWALAQPLSDAPGDRRPVHRIRGAGRCARARQAAGARHRRRRLRRGAGYARRNSCGHRRRTASRPTSPTARLLADLDGEVDLVVANPPYIPDGAVLEPEVAEHDPAHALFGGPDGMEVIGPIVALAARLLRPGGLARRRARRHHRGRRPWQCSTETGAFARSRRAAIWPADPGS